MLGQGRAQGVVAALTVAIVMLVAASGAQAVVPGANGKIFYETGNGPGDIWSADPDGMNGTNLTGTASTTEERPSVTSDGSLVTFMTPQPADGNNWEIWKMNGNGSSPVQVTHTGTDIVNFEPGFSPDGSKIVFQRQDATAQDLWSINPNGSGETDLTNTPYPTVPGANSHSDECCAEYSPDGTKIVYVNAYNAQDDTATYNNDIWAMNANGSNQHALTTTDGPIQNIGPSWSPDGTKIVFASVGRASPGQDPAENGLYVMDSNGTNLTQLLNDSGAQILGYNPTWSPDGTEIAYSTGSGLAVIPATGGDPAPLVFGNDQDYPSWASEASDTTPPNTTITAGPPPFTKNTTANFGFTSSEPGSTFKCRLDGAALFTNCSSPKSYSGLAEGAHIFRVRATDAAANTDPTPATRSFTVDTTPPNTTISSGPSGTIHVRNASFGFTSSEAGSHFQCRMDGAAFTACTSPKGYAGLANGSHTFRVRSIDKAGNVDPTPVARTFSVQP